MDRKSLTRHLRDGLAHFYDPVFLQTSPLSRLVVESDPLHRAIALRQLLREAIEALKPPSAIPFGAPEWLAYRLLWEHYIQRKSPYRICDEVGLGRTTFYRYRQKAVEALAELLWERYRQSEAGKAQGPGKGESPEDEIAIQEALKLAREAERRRIAPAELLQNVCPTLAPLFESLGVQIDIEASAFLPCVYGDPALLRQIVIQFLMGVVNTSAAEHLRLSVTGCEKEVRWSLCGEGVDIRWEELIDNTPEFAFGQRLLEVYDGRFWLEQPDRARDCICWALPSAEPQKILVIDDDEDAIRLYCHCLKASGYVVHVAKGDEEIIPLVKAVAPNAVLLDVLMPREDGWMVLQRLKTIPETADIPVVVYSVPSQPSLALSLGASEVLRKPIEECTLLEAVGRVLRPPDRSGQHGREGHAGIPQPALPR